MTEKINPTSKQLRVFGYGLAVILSFICYRLFVKHGWELRNTILIVLAVGFFIVTAVNYNWLTPVYTRWMWVAQKIGGVMTAVILLVFFCMVFIPVGILLKILKKDFLNRTLDPAAASYWNMRPKDISDNKRYTQQF